MIESGGKTSNVSNDSTSHDEDWLMPGYIVLLQLHLMSTFLKTTVWVRIGNNDQTLYIAKERIVEFFK